MVVLVILAWSFFFFWIFSPHEIHNFAHRFRNGKETPSPIIHYVPSHIELTSLGKRRTGNCYADKLATEGRLKARANDKTKYLQRICEKILTASINSIDQIESRLQIFFNPDGSPTSTDDLSACTYADRDLFNENIS